MQLSRSLHVLTVWCFGYAVQDRAFQVPCQDGSKLWRCALSYLLVMALSIRRPQALLIHMNPSLQLQRLRHKHDHLALAEKTWKVLEDAIQEINNHNASGLSFEELYRFVCKPCTICLIDRGLSQNTA